MGTPLPPFDPALPLPPQPTDTRQQQAAVARAFAEHYWPLYFERSPTVDPASFFERLFYDYANHEQDLIGDWTKDMSPVYRIYKVCLQYGTKNGTSSKGAEAKMYQGVSPTLFCALANSC